MYYCPDQTSLLLVFEYQFQTQPNLKDSTIKLWHFSTFCVSSLHLSTEKTFSLGLSQQYNLDWPNILQIMPKKIRISSNLCNLPQQ